MTPAQQRGNTGRDNIFFQAALAAFSTGDLQSAVRYCDPVLSMAAIWYLLVETM